MRRTNLWDGESSTYSADERSELMHCRLTGFFGPTTTIPFSDIVVEPSPAHFCRHVRLSRPKRSSAIECFRSTEQ